MGSGTWSSATYSAVSGAKIRAGATFDYSARATGVHEKLDPKRLNAAGQNIRESRDSDEHPASTPIIVGFDETGSMGSIPRLVLTKLKTLFSLLVDKGYATDPQISRGRLRRRRQRRARPAADQPVRVGQPDRRQPRPHLHRGPGRRQQRRDLQPGCCTTRPRT